MMMITQVSIKRTALIKIFLGLDIMKSGFFPAVLQNSYFRFLHLSNEVLISHTYLLSVEGNTYLNSV